MQWTLLIDSKRKIKIHLDKIVKKSKILAINCMKSEYIFINQRHRRDRVSVMYRGRPNQAGSGMYLGGVIIKVRKYDKNPEIAKNVLQKLNKILRQKKLFLETNKKGVELLCNI